MSEQVPDTDLQQLHHFISDSPWEWEGLLDHLFVDTYLQLSLGRGKVGFLIDESGWKKQGKHSVGVSRQYLGSVGKVDNGQVAVVGSLCQGVNAQLVDFALYVPRVWTDDPTRCDRAGIPKKDQVFKTKPELAQQLVSRAWDRGVELAWVGGDGAYGHDTKFRRWLDDQGQFYLLDIHQDDQVYLEDPCPILPPSPKGKGRPRTRLQTDAVPVKVQDLWGDNGEQQAQPYGFRKGSKGLMRRKVWTRQVYTWDGKEATARQETLIISSQLDGANLKYSLANNGLARHGPKMLLSIQMQRFWVEQSIKEAKSELGMHHYQVRSWRAWHHHMALTCLALAFMLKIRKSYKEEVPLLSCNDIRTMLAHLLPKKPSNEQIIWEIIKLRHKKRQADIDRYTPK